MSDKDVNRERYVAKLENENWAMNRTLRRQRWFWRGLALTAIVATVAVANQDRKNQNEK